MTGSGRPIGVYRSDSALYLSYRHLFGGLYCHLCGGLYCHLCDGLYCHLIGGLGLHPIVGNYTTCLVG